MTAEVGELVIPASAKLKPGELIRVLGPGSWELVGEVMTAAEGMAKVLETHRAPTLFPLLSKVWECRCGALTENWDTHVADMLAAAGYRLLADASEACTPDPAAEEEWGVGPLGGER